MYNAGDLILSCKPYAFAISTVDHDKRCDNCTKIMYAKFSCHHCNYVMYCSRQCQRDGKAMHEHECRTLATRPLSTLTRLIARIIAKLGSDPNAHDVVFGKTRRFDDLMNHYDDVVHDPSAMFAFNSIYTELESIFCREFDLQWLLGVYGRVLVNSFALQDEMVQPIGRAVYLGASIFDHSCVPNAAFCFVGTTIYIKAIKEIKGNDHNRIRICYIDELETTEDRIRQLFALYYFICDCERCNKPSFTRIAMTEDAKLRDICDDMEDLGLDNFSIYDKKRHFERRSSNNSSNSYRSDAERNSRTSSSSSKAEDAKLLLHLVDNDERKKKKALRLLDKIERTRKSALSMHNVLSIRIADLISAFEGNTELALKVIDYFRIFYGRSHPRLALKLYLTAMIIQNNNLLKQKLLLEAKNITSIYTPSVAEQMRSNILADIDVGITNSGKNVGHDRGRQRERCRLSSSSSTTTSNIYHSRTRHQTPTAEQVVQPQTQFDTLLSLVDKELKATQQAIQFKASLSNAKCKSSSTWRSSSVATRDYSTHRSRDFSSTRRPALRMY